MTVRVSKTILYLAVLALSVHALFSLGQRSAAAKLPEALPATRTSSPSGGATRLSIASKAERPALEALEVPDIVRTWEQIRSLPSGDSKAIEFDIPQVNHFTAPGETLTDIAGQYQVSVDWLQELNGLIDPHNLLIGQELVIFAGPEELNAQRALAGKTDYQREVIGTSAHGHPLESFRIGDGRHDVIVVGAIHGGYEWNTALLAYRFLTYFSVYPEKIPDNVSLHLIPIANPDGVVAVIGKSGPFMAVDVSGDTTVGRLNGNGIDLNRNWGCQWSPVAWWRETNVSAGSRPFSEPETKALREYLIKIEPQVVIWLHSAAGLVIPGNCEGIYHAPSEKAALLYGGYPLGEFDAYQITGDAADWLAQHKIASFTVELSDHQGLEFAQNLAGLTSLMAGIEALDEE